MRNRKSGFKYVATIMVLVLFYFAYIIHGQMGEISKLDNTLKEKIEKSESIEYKITELEKEIKDSDSLKFIEKIARDEYGMVKPKEVIFVDKDKKEAINPFENK